MLNIPRIYTPKPLTPDERPIRLSGHRLKADILPAPAEAPVRQLRLAPLPSVTPAWSHTARRAAPLHTRLRRGRVTV